jgi:hypothetical protein
VPIFNNVGCIGDVFRKSEILLGQRDRQALPLEFNDDVGHLPDKGATR